VSHLDVAITRSGRTAAEVGHLTGLGEARIRSLIAGETATERERALLARMLPDWNGGQS
jgi:hypothetical protein